MTTPHAMRRAMMFLIGSLPLLLASIAIAYYQRNDAFVYIDLLWLTACVLVLWRATSTLRLWALYAGTAFLTLAVYEAFLGGWFSAPTAQFVNFELSDPTYFQLHPLLGVVPKRDVQVRATKTSADTRIYDVRYTIDANGLRIGPPTGAEATPAVLFFGCSFTFGEGVDDDETLPYQFGERAGGRFQSLNFGFHGYGPHQMLAMLEHAMERDALGGHRAAHAVYQALVVDHVERCAGHAWWDTSGPRYVLDPQGHPVRAGPFHSVVVSRFMTILARSNIARRWLSTKRPVTADEADLFVGIVETSARLFHERHHGTFHVLLWGDESPAAAAIAGKLAATGLDVISIDTILPDLRTDGNKYQIALDGHPSPLAYEKIAAYLVQHLGDAR